MFLPESSKSEDVEHLLRNAQLRDELEPRLANVTGSSPGSDIRV